jgi:hypothetical protein
MGGMMLLSYLVWFFAGAVCTFISIVLLNTMDVELDIFE